MDYDKSYFGLPMIPHFSDISNSISHRTTSQRKRRMTSHKSDSYLRRHRKARRMAK